MSHALPDPGITKDTSIVITVINAAEIYLNKERVAKERLAELTKKMADDKPEDQRIVYLKGDVNAPYGNIVEILKTIRNAELDTIKLVVGKLGDTSVDQEKMYCLEILLPAQNDPSVDWSKIHVKPNPLSLLVDIGADGKLKLNAEELGTIVNPSPLAAKLSNIFNARKEGAGRMGEVERMVILKAPISVKYGDVAKVIDAIAGAGSEPIVPQLEEGVPVVIAPKIHLHFGPR